MKWKHTAVLVSFLMVAMAFAVVASAEDNVPTAPKLSNLDNYLMAKKEFEMQAAQGVFPSNHDIEGFSYVDGPYPIYNDDGTPPGTQQAWGDYYVSDVMYAPPHNPGGWYSQDATGGAGEYGMGDTHESWIGDQNGNGVIEWISGYSKRTYGEDGIDNDGDGCVDEKTYGNWDGQVGCDMVPDQITYFETGGLPDAGGDDGTLMTLVDWYSTIQAVEVWRAGASPLWMAYQSRGFMYYPQIAGEHISYYAYEGSNGVNANPEMDSDQSDYYVGNVDARGFPARPPVDRPCSAGYQIYMGITFKRDDGWVVTSYELREMYDGVDWNDDGFIGTNPAGGRISAYYAIDPTTGNCRDNAVNTGVWGRFPRNTGVILTPGDVRENRDRRDWDQDGLQNKRLKLYHTIDTTWAMKGKVYTSYTFTASVPTWGFGWWSLYSLGAQQQTYPLKFGGAFFTNLGYSQGYYHTFFFLVSDDDGNRHTLPPLYDIGIGQPSASPGGQCIQMYTREYNAHYGGVRLIGNRADANGDGDTSDTYNTVFCPDEVGGGGSWVVEETSKYAKGLYRDSIPVINLGYVYYAADGVAGGLAILPYFYYEYSQNDDANGNLVREYIYFHTYYWFYVVKPDFEIVPGSFEWLVTGDVQPGGTVLGTFDLINTGAVNIEITEDTGIENDKGFKIQGLNTKDRIGPDGVIEPQEVATFYFAMTVPAGAPIGPLDVNIILTFGGVTKEETIILPIILKMFGNDMSCYRHRQSALRKLRSFDMDDDEGMLHNLEPGDLVNIDGQLVAAEEAILLMISWFENGCRETGHEDVEHAKSAASGLTGHYGMGQAYWGFIPGQENGNEGNGNGGLNGKARKDVYGF